MSGNGIDAASFGAGVGAGQAIGRGESDSAVAAERGRANIAAIEAKGAQSTSLALAVAVKLARDKNEVLEGEIANRWIPYAVTLRASLVARRVERDDLIAELRRLDPANAENVIKQADQHRLDEFDTLKGEKLAAKLAPIDAAVRQESEEGRLDR